MGQVSLLVQQNTLPLDQRHYFLEDVVSSQIYLIDEDPISIFECCDKIPLHERKDQVAVYFIQISKNIGILSQHLVPCPELFLGGVFELDLNFWDGLDQAFK